MGLIAFGSSMLPAAAAEVPCEDMLKQVEAAMKVATLSDADKAKVTELRDKGVERCKADDDKRADMMFGDALKLMGKGFVDAQ